MLIVDVRFTARIEKVERLWRKPPHGPLALLNLLCLTFVP